MATRIPENSATFMLSEVAHLMNVDIAGGNEVVMQGITTDSRANVAGKMFVALSGGRYDGHDYLQQVANGGAVAVLVERDPGVALSIPVLKVASTIRALGELSTMHRRRWAGKLIAIAGSAGKTTTRVACQALFEAAYPGRVHATSGNLNNQIGVPMTLLGLTPSHEFAIVEVGTNCLGEVRLLAEMCQPDIAILTLIGLEHAEGLGDLDPIEREEGDVFQSLGPSGVAIGNGDDWRIVRQMSERASGSRCLTFGQNTAVDYSVSHQINQNLDHTLITIQRSQKVGGDRLEFASALLATPGALAAAAALAAVESTGFRAEDSLAEKAFGRRQLGEDGRLRVVKLEGGIVVLDDSYNANPPSMASSVAVAQQIARTRQARLIAILGEMRELGSLSEREHRSLGARLAGVDVLFVVGKEALPLFESASSEGVCSEYFETSALVAARVASVVAAGDVVLVKGSRGVMLEVVVQQLVSQKGIAA